MLFSCRWAVRVTLTWYQSIAPLLVVLRMAQGRAWTKEIVHEASTATQEQLKASEDIQDAKTQPTIVSNESRMLSRSSVTLNRMH